jgi:hypothetical protein
MSRTLSIAVLSFALAAPLAAQQTTPTAAPAPSGQVAVATPRPSSGIGTAQGGGGRGGAVVTASPTMNRITPDPRFDTAETNIEVTVTIHDAQGAQSTADGRASSGKSMKKTVSMLIANGSSARVRSTGVAGPQAGPRASNPDLNADVSVQLLKSGLIRVGLVLTYTPETTDNQSQLSQVSQQATALLKDGQPLTLTQAADPTYGMRTVAVELTAKILK